ncbi:MAG: YgiT-type zinc finger protein [Phycisphaerae bacterium]|nr:YgiT-type zinc finger protein [Phycisphaerae bacterium]
MHPSEQGPGRCTQLPRCVSCGSRRVERKEVTVTLRAGRAATGINADVCLDCGERYFDMAAMEKLESTRRG